MLKCKDLNFCLDSDALANCICVSQWGTNTSFCLCQNSCWVWVNLLELLANSNRVRPLPRIPVKAAGINPTSQSRHT